MKYSITVLIAFLWVMARSFALDPLPMSGYRGNGEHFQYDAKQWGGSEQTITRLQKNGHAILFVRTAKGEFEVRKESPKREVFFKFSTKEEAMSPGLNRVVMVDFVQAGDAAAVLLIGDYGYYYAVASAAMPQMNYPLCYLLPKALKTDKWHLTSHFGPSGFYYSERPEEVEGRIRNVRITKINEVEFEWMTKSDESAKKDIFIVGEGSLLKNGVKVADGAGSPGLIVAGRLNLEVISKKIQLGGYKMEDLRSSLACYDNAELFAALARIKDEQEREKVKRLVNSAFESK